MKLFLGSVLALAIAGSPLLARQEPQDDKDKPKQEEPKAKPKPEDKAKPEDKNKPKQEPQPKQDDKQQKADKERQKQDERPQQETNRPAQQRQNAPQAAPSGREQAQGGHGRGQRIPEERYRAAFGREHHVHVRHAEQRFQYGGYWFEVVQPWPAAWVADDDCYIEEDGDGYFLVDLVHPDWRVEVIVVQG